MSVLPSEDYPLRLDDAPSSSCSGTVVAYSKTSYIHQSEAQAMRDQIVVRFWDRFRASHGLAEKSKPITNGRKG